MPAKISVPALLGALLCIPAFPQMSYREPRNISEWQNALPSEGAAAARFNPAYLADAHLAAGWGAYSAFVSGKSERTVIQTAFSIPPELGIFPFGLAAGLGSFGNASAIDGNTAIYREQEYVPALAAAYPASLEVPWRISAGLSFPIALYNAFNLVKTRTRGLDAGFQGAYSLPGTGRIGLGFAYRYLSAPRIRLPDGNGYYTLPGWMEYATAWTSAGEGFRARLELYMNEPHDRREGPATEDRVGINGWEVEWRPRPWIGLKFERTRISRQSTLGAIFRPALPWDHARAFFALDLGHDRVYLGGIPLPGLKFLFGERGRDEGRGLLFNLALGAEI